MVATPLVLFLAFAQRPKDQYTLGYLDGRFVVRIGAKTENVPRVPAARPKDHLSFRIDRRWAVWDVRGLTTRDGDWTAVDRLEAVPTNPKAQEKDAIRATLAAVKAGDRTLAATGLSGARRIGAKVYLLPRWEATDGKPWLEVLVAVDLSKPHPKPRLLGVFPGLSLGRGPLDDRLGVQNGRLAVAVNGDGTWGYATFDPAQGKFGFDERGKRLLDLDGDRVIEETTYGTHVVGRLAKGRTEPWMELRAPAEFVPGDGPVLVRAGSRLHNAESGAEVRVPKNAALRRTDAGLLLFWPEKAPRSARLLDYDRLEEIARWEKGTRASDGKVSPPARRRASPAARRP